MSTQTKKQYRNVQVIPRGQEGEGHLEGEYYEPIFGNWVRFRGTLELMRIHDVLDEFPEANARIWNLQDGYGEPGYTPCQGWDWSGIRDSSDEAKVAMDNIAREYVSDADYMARLGLA